MKIQKQTLTVLLVVFFIFQIKAQNLNKYYFEFNVAYNLAKAGKVDSAIATYEDAFRKLDYVQIRYLQKVLELAKLKKDKARIKKYSQQIKKQNRGTNPYLIAIIDSLIKEDQKVRKGKFYRKSKYMWKCDKDPNCNKQSEKYIDSKKYNNNWKRIDSSNVYFLLNLFKRYGFIGEEQVGLYKYGDVITILIHFDRDTSNTILEPILRKALKEGEIYPIDFTAILDRHLGGKYTIQKYWTWPDLNKKKYPFTEADIPKIIKLRESVGIYGSSLRQEKRGKYWIIRNEINR